MLTKAHLLRLICKMWRSCPLRSLLRRPPEADASVGPSRAPCIWTFLNILQKQGLSTNL